MKIAELKNLLKAGDSGTKLALSRHQVLNPLLAAGQVEMTIPDKPRSSKQKYRLTERGRQAQEGRDEGRE